MKRGKGVCRGVEALLCRRSGVVRSFIGCLQDLYTFVAVMVRCCCPVMRICGFDLSSAAGIPVFCSQIRLHRTVSTCVITSHHVTGNVSPGIQALACCATPLWMRRDFGCRFLMTCYAVHNLYSGCSELLTVRVLLQDIRTFVAVDETALAATHPNATDAREIWGYYPDDSPLKGLHAGDTRAALAPFLAHQV